MKNKKFYQALFASTVAAAVVVQAPVAFAGFHDVAEGTEASKAINKLVALNITNGYGDGKFKPTKEITRAEAAKMLSELYASANNTFVPEGASKFSDVPANHWAKDHIGFANDMGWINGYIDGTFGIDGILTRGQFAKILASYIGVTDADITLPFTDVAPGIWYEDGVKVLLDLGITTGTSETTFSPGQPITREQFAIFLDRANLLTHANVETGDHENNEIDTQYSNVTEWLTAYAATGQQYNGSHFKEFLQLLKTEEEATMYGTAEDAPLIYTQYGEFEGIKEGTYIFSLSLDYNSDERHIFSITFNKNSVQSFKVYTGEAFEEYLATQTAGPQQFASFIQAGLEKYPNTEVTLSTLSDDIFSYAQVTQDSWYIDYQGNGSGLLLATYSDYEMDEEFYEAYQIDHTFNGELTLFTVKRVPAIQVFDIPEGYQFANITNAGSKNYEDAPIFATRGFSNTVTLFALTKENPALKVGDAVELKLVNYVDFTPNYTTIKYVYNGHTFVAQ